MSPVQISKFLIIAALVAYCWSTQAEARPMTQQEAMAMASFAAGQQQNVGRADQNMLMNGALSNLEQADSDGDDDDDDDKSNLQLQDPRTASGTDVYQNQQQSNNALLMDQSYPKYQAVPSTSADLQTQASHHHHGHGAKGWLDMGAWTGKKGSFGWYDKHPVGKGK